MSVVAVVTAGSLGEWLFFGLVALAVDLVAAVRVLRLGSDRYRFGGWSKLGWLVVIFGVTWHLGALDIPIGALLALNRSRTKPGPPTDGDRIPFAEGGRMAGGMGVTALSDRVVVVHGPADRTLDIVLRSGGLVPVHEAEGAVIWAAPSVSVPDKPSVAPPGSGKLLLSIVEAAARLSVGRSTVYQLINRGDLDVVHVGRAVRIPAAAVEGLVDRLRG